MINIRTLTIGAVVLLSACGGLVESGPTQVDLDHRAEWLNCRFLECTGHIDTGACALHEKELTSPCRTAIEASTCAILPIPMPTACGTPTCVNSRLQDAINAYSSRCGSVASDVCSTGHVDLCIIALGSVSCGSNIPECAVPSS